MGILEGLFKPKPRTENNSGDTDAPADPTRRDFMKGSMAVATLAALGIAPEDAKGDTCSEDCRSRLETEIRRQNSQIDSYADLNNLSKNQCDEFGRQRHIYAAACKRLKEVDPSNELCAKCSRQQQFYDVDVWNACKHHY